MGAITTFDYACWIAAFPEFSNIEPGQAEMYFGMASDYWRNDGTGPIDDATRQTRMMYMLTAHIAALMAGANGQPAGTMVGRITSASEGSVSVSTDFKGDGSPSEAFFIQTKYGAMAWQAMAQYRTARYVARPTIVVDSAFPYWRMRI